MTISEIILSYKFSSLQGVGQSAGLPFLSKRALHVRIWTPLNNWRYFREGKELGADNNFFYKNYRLFRNSR